MAHQMKITSAEDANRLRCPNGHSSVGPTNNHWLCVSCARHWASHEAEFDFVVDAKTGRELRREDVEIDHRALESWSTFPEHARQFAEEGDGNGVLITTEIPVERVYGASHTTPGLHEEENEIVAALDSTETYSPDQIHDATDDGMAEVYDKLLASMKGDTNE